MSTPIRLAVFAVGLVVAFATAWGVGSFVDPLLDEPVAAHDMGDEAAGHEPAAHLPGGLSVTEGGYTLDLVDDRLAAGPRTVSFTITDPAGDPLLDYEPTHTKRLHLIAVRRDFTGYQHVHPTMSPGGVWFADLNLSPGSWRLFTDFVPFAGEGLTLGADLIVPGRVTTVPNQKTTTATVDGYTVTLTGDLGAETSSDVTVSVARDGDPVTDLEPYLGAYGHLVALRAGDLAYLHVHPEEGSPGPDVPFVAEVPSAGDFHLYFDFQHDGVVRTAEFLLAAEAGEPGDH